MQDVRLSYAVLALAVLAIVVFLVAPVDSVWQIANLVPELPAAVCLYARARTTAAESRRPLRFLRAGQLIYFALSIPWYFVPVYFHRELPFPSVLDPLYFVSYTLYAVFLVSVLRRQTSSTHAGIAATDALIVTTALTSAVWVWIIHPQVATSPMALGAVVAVLYPVFTLLLFGLAARLAIGGGIHRTLPGALLLLFVAAEVAGDLFYGIQSVNGTFRHGGALTATWMVSYTAPAALAAHPGMLNLLNRRAGPPRVTALIRETGRSQRLVVLWIAALVPVALAGFSDKSLLLFGAAALTFSLVIVRTFLLSRMPGRQAREL
jgi:hypothetical protein